MQRFQAFRLFPSEDFPFAETMNVDKVDQYPHSMSEMFVEVM